MRYAIKGAVTGAEPISITEAKEQVNQTEAVDDVLLASLVTVARSEMEELTRRRLVRGSMVDAVSECDLPGAFGRIQLLSVPAIALTALSYIQRSTLATIPLTLTDYTLRTYDDYAYVVPASGKTWPYDAEEIRVTYTTGYNQADVPTPIKQAVRIRVAQLYADREGAAEAANDKTIKALVWPWRTRIFE